MAAATIQPTTCNASCVISLPFRSGQIRCALFLWLSAVSTVGLTWLQRVGYTKRLSKVWRLRFRIYLQPYNSVSKT